MSSESARSATPPRGDEEPARGWGTRRASGAGRPPTTTTITAAAAGIVALSAVWWLLHLERFHHLLWSDVGLYQSYGDAVRSGRVPYVDFELGYPPGALPVFVLPSFVGEYVGTFEFLMLLCGCAAVACSTFAAALAGATPLRLFAVAAFVGVAPLALGAIALNRYDLWPAALTVAALAALVAPSVRIAFALLALAATAKLYALALLPIMVAYAWRRAGRRRATEGLVLFAAVVLLLFTPFAFGSDSALLTSGRQTAGRDLEIESLGAAALVAADRVGLYEASVANTRSSVDLRGELPETLAAVTKLVQALAVGVVWLLFVRGPPSEERVFAAAAAAVTGAIALGPVLSPQFLLWLIPLVPLVAGRSGLAAAGLLTAALLLTQAWFPARFVDLIALERVAWLVLARDAVLLVLYGLLTWRLAAGSRPITIGRRASG